MARLLPNVPIVTDPVNLVYLDSGDWPKMTFDFPWKSVEEARIGINQMGWTVEKFKALDAYKLALDSGEYPWLADL